MYVQSPHTTCFPPVPERSLLSSSPALRSVLGLGGCFLLAAVLFGIPAVAYAGWPPLTIGTVGGLIVNDKAEVLNDNNAAIENLYAVGELTCVQVLDTVHFSAGENSSWNIYSGRIAGLAAASSIGE